MKVFSKVLAGVLAVAMMLSLTSCGDNSWVYEYDGERVTSGVYLANLLDGYYNVAEYEEFAEITTPEEFISATTAEGTSVEDEIVKVTRNNISQTLYAMSELKKVGVEVSEEEINSMKDYAASMYESYAGLYDVNGVGLESYKTYYSSLSYYDKYFQYLYTDTYADQNGGEKAPATQEYLDYYKENYVNFYVISAAMSTDIVASDTVTEEQAEANLDDNLELKEVFAEYETRIKNGESIEAIRIEEADRLDVELETDEAGNVLPMEVSIEDLANIESTSPDVAKALKEMNPGDVKYVDATAVAYLIVKNELVVNENDDNFKNAKSDMLYSMKSEEYQDWLKEQVDNIELIVNDYAVELYSPKKLEIANY